MEQSNRIMDASGLLPYTRDPNFHSLPFNCPSQDSRSSCNPPTCKHPGTKQEIIYNHWLPCFECVCAAGVCNKANCRNPHHNCPPPPATTTHVKCGSCEEKRIHCGNSNKCFRSADLAKYHAYCTNWDFKKEYCTVIVYGKYLNQIGGSFDKCKSYTPECMAILESLWGLYSKRSLATNDACNLTLELTDAVVLFGREGHHCLVTKPHNGCNFVILALSTPPTSSSQM